ncbi:MAG: nucleotidyltransferase domain-containing protein [Bacteroidota bacterium]
MGASSLNTKDLISQHIKIRFSNYFSYFCSMNNRQQIVLARIKKQVKEIDPLADVILYGSRARGDSRPDSDWDILILVNSPADIETEKVFRHKLYDVELDLGEAVSTYVYNKQEWNTKYWMTPLFKNISSEGIVI